MTYRFHILGIPHTATNKQWLCCAYTQKVLKLCAMLKGLGHTVIHYGNADSDVVCDEHVTVTARADIGAPEDYMGYDLGSPVYATFHRNAAAEIAKRKQQRDFLLCMWGAGHQPVANAHGGLIVVEPGIGYAGGYFAPWKVFESYAMLHAHYGIAAVGNSDRFKWYDAVIPNYFEPGDFSYSADKDDYLLFLGRVYDGKGVGIAIELAQKTGTRLIVAGPGTRPDGECEFVGIVDEHARRKLLARARALIAPSLFLEPFCGVVTEAHFSGTPTITTDWGSFAENNLHGITGYRCRTFSEFAWAVGNIDQIKPIDCRRWAEANFSTQRVSALYQAYFESIMDIYTGKGWYEPHPDRRDLDYLKRRYPSWELRLAMAG